jgi:hypothetical protein
MANPQQNPLKKASLFSPELFADPETLSQISQVENPPPPAAMDQIPMRGAIPQSFTEWAIDPMNLSKIAPPAPRNTPMPSVVAQKAAAAADAGFLKPVTTAPPIESSQPQPSLEDSLMAPAPESSVIKGPPSRQDFFASLPGGHAAIPGPPPSYQGKKLAAMGLFTALDTIGAALTHGEPTVGPGLIRNAQALAEYKRSLPATQSAADTAAYEQSLKEGGLVNAQTKTPVTIQGPNGPMTVMADPATLKTLLPAQVRAQGTVESAKVGAQSRMDVKQLELQIQQGQISKMVPGINPANGQPQYEAFNKAGKSLGFIDHSVVPGLIARTSSTVEYKEDGDGNLHALPKTTVSAPALPGGAGNKISGPPKIPPPGPSGQPANTIGPSGAPSQPGAAVAGPRRTGQPSTQGGIVPGFQGKAAVETGTAYDPQSNQYYITTRHEASQNGYQNFTKSSAAQIENDRQLNNRLADVQQKIDRFDQSMQKTLSADDKYVMSKLMSDQHFEAAFKPFGVGVTIPTGFVTELDKAAQANGLSPEARQRLQAYFNAREAMSGYQRVLTGSSRGSEKTLQLQLDVLPSPLVDPDFAKEAFGQFGENLRIAGQGLPRMPGVQTADDVKNRNAGTSKNGDQNTAPEGTVIQVGDQKQIKRGGKWVPLQ